MNVAHYVETYNQVQEKKSQCSMQMAGITYKGDWLQQTVSMKAGRKGVALNTLRSQNVLPFVKAY